MSDTERVVARACAAESSAKRSDSFVPLWHMSCGKMSDRFVNSGSSHRLMCASRSGLIE